MIRCGPEMNACTCTFTRDAHSNTVFVEQSRSSLCFECESTWTLDVDTFNFWILRNPEAKFFLKSIGNSTEHHEMPESFDRGNSELRRRCGAAGC